MTFDIKKRQNFYKLFIKKLFAPDFSRFHNFRAIGYEEFNFISGKNFINYNVFLKR